MTRRAPFLLRLACGLPFLLATAAAAQSSVFDEAWSTVRRNFYDRRMHGVDWEAVREEYRPEFDAAESQEEEYDVIRRMLGELGASHTALIEEDVYRDHFENEMNGKRRRQAGVEIAHTDEGWFVTSVLEGSHAWEAGVRKGDGVIAIDGEDPADSPLLADAGGDTGIPGDPHYFLRLPDDGEPFRLSLQSEHEGAVRDVEFAPTSTSMITATRNSVRVIESKGRRLGYIHLWHFLHTAIADHFDQAIQGPLADCDGLILDIRGRGGSPFVLERVLSRFRKRGSWMWKGVRWKKPVVLLIDENSRSAKEIFAHKFKKERLGPVVGRATPGAVLGSTFFPLKDGSVLLLPIMDASGLSGGDRLEGVGVEPTIPVPTPDRWTDGGDPILEEGVRQAIRQVRLREAI